MGVSKNNGTPKSSILYNEVFHYKPSILGYCTPIFGNTHISYGGLHSAPWRKWSSWFPIAAEQKQMGFITIEVQSYEEAIKSLACLARSYSENEVYNDITMMILVI